MISWEELNQLQQELLEELKKFGKCIHCGKEDKYNGAKVCADCMLKTIFEHEALVWQGERLTLEEYAEYRRVASELVNDQ